MWFLETADKISFVYPQYLNYNFNIFIFITLVIPNLRGYQLSNMHVYEFLLHAKISVSNKLCPSFNLSTVAIILVLQNAEFEKHVIN